MKIIISMDLLAYDLGKESSKKSVTDQGDESVNITLDSQMDNFQLALVLKKV